MRKSSTNFLPYITSIGGLLSYEFLHNLRSEDPKIDYLTPETFKAIGGSHPLFKRELDEQITDAWNDLLETWDSISLRYEKMELSEARTKWIIPLLESLGFDPQYNKQNVIAGEDGKLSFRISHKGFNVANAPYINCVSPSQNLEEVAKSNEDSSGSKRGHKSPHDELQSFLNVSKGCKWGIVTNGISFRILRQFYHTTTKAYVEFDLENIFRSRSFSDFRLLYRTAHVSRFLLFDEKKADDKTKQTCILEEFYGQSKAAGVSAGEDLRKNVKVAIESLANGFLTPDLAQKMAQDEDFCRNYYAEILRVIYRMIFLLFAEQRGMLPTSGSLYAEEYSMNRLREIAIQTTGRDDHTDLWEGLKITFRMLKQGCADPGVGVFAYNGTLFDDLETPLLSNLLCKNSDLCTAVRNLTSIERGNVSNRINYLDLGVQEIGSIYESLLDYIPRIATVKQEIEGNTVFPNMFFLDPRGASRKTTGSYYTDPRLIDELIHSALEPVVRDRLSNAVDRESALLSIKVCDPACGSGAFLIAANNFLARELAKMRTRDQLEPSEKEVRRARREVLQHCIYGVDVNPMAVELAKVSLWINASVENFPLNFLDHHIKCGNSLIGTNPELIKNGVPSSAFEPVTNDDKQISKRLQKANDRLGDFTRLEDFIVTVEPEIRSRFDQLANLSERKVSEVEEKKKLYADLILSDDYKVRKIIADTWTVPFFWPFEKGSPEAPTTSVIHSLEKNGIKTIKSEQLEEVLKLSNAFRFFHWYLEFPDVFGVESQGFDCILGNPPWDIWQPEEKKFFESSAPEIAGLSGNNRKKAIENLRSLNPKLYESWLLYKRSIETTSKFWSESKRFSSGIRGRLNTFALFADLAIDLVNKSGNVGIVVPTAIATDESCKELFASLVKTNAIRSLIDFENKNALFPVHRSYKFCLLTLSQKKNNSIGKYSFFLTDPDEIMDERRTYHLGPSDFEKLNPNTLTCPNFRTKFDAELTARLYDRFPILLNSKTGSNPWGITIRRLYNMGVSEVHRRTTFAKSASTDLPIWESKMIWQYDHRYATYKSCSKESLEKGHPKEVDVTEKIDSKFEVLPRRWMPEKWVTDTQRAWSVSHKWLLSIRDITNATNERTIIASIIPHSAPDFTLRVLFTKRPNDVLLLLANLNSIVMDYIARQKIGGMHLSDYITEQLPVIPPEIYTPKHVSFIVSRALELTYTSIDLAPFAAELGFTMPPFKWDEERRSILKAQLDAFFAILYGLTRKDLSYILDPQDVMGGNFPSETFRVLRSNEMRKFGDFKTKSLIMKYFDDYTSLDFS
jgi:hypothetical protein